MSTGLEDSSIDDDDDDDMVDIETIKEKVDDFTMKDGIKALLRYIVLNTQKAIQSLIKMLTFFNLHCQDISASGWGVSLSVGLLKISHAP